MEAQVPVGLVVDPEAIEALRLLNRHLKGAATALEVLLKHFEQPQRRD